MGPYHAVMAHFPIALWLTATLIIVIRAFSESSLAKSFERVLVPLLLWGAITGVITYAVGLLVWPFEALSASPLGRNHMLTASWALAYWVVLLYVAWEAGTAAWEGIMRWVMLGMGLLGSGLLAITGTLGGHLIGSPTMVSSILRTLGWEVYETFYVPTATIVLILLATLALAYLARKAGKAV